MISAPGTFCFSFSVSRSHSRSPFLVIELQNKESARSLPPENLWQFSDERIIQSGEEMLELINQNGVIWQEESKQKLDTEGMLFEKQKLLLYSVPRVTCQTSASDIPYRSAAAWSEHLTDLGMIMQAWINWIVRYVLMIRWMMIIQIMASWNRDYIYVNLHEHTTWLVHPCTCTACTLN